MEWEQIKLAGFIEIGGERCDLGHLSDRVHNYTIEANEGRQQLRFEVLVQYSSHCVSLGAERRQDGSKPGDDRWFCDEKGNDRWFCHTRFALSQKHLPGIFANIDRKAFFTGHHNWLTVEVLTEERRRLEYEIFFSLRRASERFLRLYVESAYVRDDPRTRPHPEKRRPIRLRTIFAKTLRGEGFKAPTVA